MASITPIDGVESTSFTWWFREVFPTADEWRAVIKEFGFVNYQDSTQDAFDTYCYSVLFNRFRNSSIRYSDLTNFYYQLAGIYQNKFEKYLREVDSVRKLYKLTDEEIELTNSAIANTARNPNTNVDPTQPLPFVSDQTFSFVKDGKLNAYLRYLQTLPSLNMVQFINDKEGDGGLSFKDLFMSVIPNQIFVYGGCNGGDIVE